MPEFSSLESPYTSIGSQSSYKNISKLAERNYSFLSYKAEILRNDQENKSKAVMEALKCLQEKIQYLESDRDQAEQNLKSLANEAHSYKQKLLFDKVKENAIEALAVSNTIGLEDKLESAKKRCEVLEKQLDNSRTVMLGKRTFSPSNKTTVDPCLLDYSNLKLSTGSFVSPSVALEHGVVKNTLNETSVHDIDKRFLPTMEKVNQLHEEHIKLSASQALTENKIHQLEKKIQEAHQKKSTPESREGDLDALDSDVKQVVNPKSSLNQEHYLMSYADIPFVVGKSSGKSHSLGANIQSVLSIMKSHNSLCHRGRTDFQPTDSRKLKQKTKHGTKRAEETVSLRDIETLLEMLQDELAQLGFAHHEVSSQMNEINNEKQQEELRKMLERMVLKMELKSNQIHLIKSHIEDHQKCSSKSTVIEPNKAKGNSKKKDATTSRVINPHLLMLKKSKLLQQTLRKGDLHWE